jgi:hypothetical protein
MGNVALYSGFPSFRDRSRGRWPSPRSMIEGDDCNFQEGDASNLHELKDHSFDLVLSRTLLLSVLLVLAGCGLSHHGHHPGDAAIDNQEPAIAKQNTDAIDQCEKLYPGSHRKPVSPRVKCFNEATLAYYAGFAEIQRSGSARAFTNKMTAIAKKYDAGQISESEFDAEKEEAITDFTNQITQRSDSAANVNATQVQASKQATLLPKQMTCVPTSSGVNCY